MYQHSSLSSKIWDASIAGEIMMKSFKRSQLVRNLLAQHKKKTGQFLIGIWSLSQNFSKLCCRCVGSTRKTNRRRTDSRLTLPVHFWSILYPNFFVTSGLVLFLMLRIYKLRCTFACICNVCGLVTGNRSFGPVSYRPYHASGEHHPGSCNRSYWSDSNVANYNGSVNACLLCVAVRNQYSNSHNIGLSLRICRHHARIRSS